MKRNLIRKIILSASVLLLASCHAWFEEKIDLQENAGTLTNLSVLRPEVKKEILDTPTQLVVSKGLDPNVIKISWNAVEDADYYRLERAIVAPNVDGTYNIPDEGDFELVNNFCYTTIYNDTIQKENSSDGDTTLAANDPRYEKRYFYRVSAQHSPVDDNKIEASAFTEWATKKLNDKGKYVFDKPILSAYGELFGNPKDVEADKGLGSSITVRWTGEKHAVYYRVYRSTSSDATDKNGYSLRSTLTSDVLSYTDQIDVNDAKAGTEFYYVITAINSRRVESDLSTKAMGYAAQAGAPTKVTGVDTSESRGKNKITVKWTESSWRATGEYDGYSLKYTVYRNSEENKAYQVVKQGIPQNTTSQVDESAVEGQKYYYYVMSYIEKDGNKIKSPFSDSGPDSKDEKGPAVAYLISAPTNISVDRIDKSYVNISFKQSVGYEYTGSTDIKGTAPYKYRVYYDDNLKGSFTTYFDTMYEGGSDSVFTITNVNTKKFYKISAFSMTGEESLKSETVAPVPDAPRNVVASKTKDIRDYCKDGSKARSDEKAIWKENSLGVFPTMITWNAPSDTSIAVGGYNVYRSKKSDSGFKKINDNVVEVSPSDDTSTVYHFIDNFDEAAPGIVYYYKVVSLNQLNQGKNGNDPDIEYMAGLPAAEQKALGWGVVEHDYWFRQFNKTIMRSQKKLTLMHKPNDMDKLGSETITGDICGTLSYKSAIAGLGAEIVMHYEKYADYYINGESNLGMYFFITGNTDTTANMSANGNMSGTVVCTGMYPADANYNGIQIKSGGAGGGYYRVTMRDLDGNTIKTADGKDFKDVNYLVGEEGRK